MKLLMVQNVRSLALFCILKWWICTHKGKLWREIRESQHWHQFDIVCWPQLIPPYHNTTQKISWSWKHLWPDETNQCSEGANITSGGLLDTWNHRWVLVGAWNSKRVAWWDQLLLRWWCKNLTKRPSWNLQQLMGACGCLKQHKLAPRWPDGTNWCSDGAKITSGGLFSTWNHLWMLVGD